MIHRYPENNNTISLIEQLVKGETFLHKQE